MNEGDSRAVNPSETVKAQVCAAIDIGTNSVKLLVAAADARDWHRIYETAAVTRLGESMQAQSLRLREAAMRRTLDALATMVTTARERGAARIVAVGTAALRDAVNRDEFLQRARERCGLDIEVIAGDEEARLSFQAVRLDARWSNCPMLLVLDIGGGSTEIIGGEPHSAGIASRISINLGAVRITETYLKSDPPTVAQLTAANSAVAEALQNVRIDASARPFTVVGVGGTLTNLAAMDRGGIRDPDELHGYVLTADRLERRIEQLASATIAQRQEMPGLDPRRADIILGGAILLSQTLACTGASDVAVSVRGLRWGLLYDRCCQ